MTILRVESHMRQALCDKLYAVRPAGSMAGLKALLFDDLRIDAQAFQALCAKDICLLCTLYRSTNTKLLKKLFGRDLS